MYVRFRFLLRNTIHDVKVQEEHTFKKKDLIVIKTPEGHKEYGEVVAVFAKEAYLEPDEGYSFVRPSREDDYAKLENFEEEAKTIFKQFEEKIEEYKLDMIPVQVRQTYDTGGLHFMFAADERIDFRELVKDLSQTFQKKIYLQQIGSRDRAGMVGGFGVCGRELCCSTFLTSTPSVTMDAVRTQNIFFKDRDKLTGLCGKLKCCLNYELDEYSRLRRYMPHIGSYVTVTKNEGEYGEKQMKVKVIGLSILDQTIRVIHEDSKDIFTVPVSASDYKKDKNKKEVTDKK